MIGIIGFSFDFEQQDFELVDNPSQARDGFNEVEPKTKIMKEYIKENLTKQANVIRDGETVTILRREIVCGDIVPIEAGDEIPADIRIIEAHGIEVDISSLTGEGNPKPLNADTAVSETMLFEAENIAFAMTKCVEGSARGIVVRCGPDTMMGRCMENAVEI